jgi:hypothetical protein
MTRDEVLGLTGRALDAAVAERVMGWTDLRDEWVRGVDVPGRNMLFGFDPECKRRAMVEYYHADIAADYAVLVRVRETWDARSRRKFRDAIEQLWCRDEESGPAWKIGPLTYRPGDYARAALLALAED